MTMKKRQDISTVKSKKFIFSIIRFGSAAILIALSLIAVQIAGANPEGVRESYMPFSRAVCDFLSRVFAVFSFSFIEVLIYVVIFGGIACILLLIFRWSRRGGRLSVIRWFSYLAVIAGAVLFFFVGTWGLNYYATPLSDYLGLDVQPRAEEELFETAEYYLELVNYYSGLVSRDEDGVYIYEDFNELAAGCENGYSALSKKCEIFAGSYSPPKRVMSWRIMSKTHITGIFIPFTAECNVNPDTTPVSVPFTMMHEMAHRLAVAPEDEANFVAIIACRESDLNEFLYSGYYSAFVYCYNAVSKISSQKQAELWNELSEGVMNDVLASISHYQKNEGTVSKVAEAVNDSYLKTMKQEAGVNSYGNVVDLLIADYMKNKSG